MVMTWSCPGDARNLARQRLYRPAQLRQQIKHERKRDHPGQTGHQAADTFTDEKERKSEKT
eukprot:750798-Hanusia_phi.AAC.1